MKLNKRCVGSGLIGAERLRFGSALGSKAPKEQVACQLQGMQNLATTILTTDNILDNWAEGKDESKGDEDGHERALSMFKKKMNDTQKMNRKHEDENVMNKDIPKEKEKTISCYIYVKDRYTKNCLLRPHKV